MSFLVNLAIGLLFGLGLVVSGMADPAKVQNFLDLFGHWDPSLAFVMGVLPMARATGAGAGSRNSLGIVIAFGMTALVVGLARRTYLETGSDHVDGEEGKPDR